MEAVGQLAGGIAHDFNNLLTAILGNSSCSSADAEDGRRARGSRPDRAAERGADLTRQLLAFSRRRRCSRSRRSQRA